MPDQAAPSGSPQVLPLTEWLPDQPAYGNPYTNTIVNAVPKSLTSYGPVASLVPIGITGIPSTEVVIGMYHFVDNESGVHVFAATEQHIYHLSLESGAEFVDATDLSTVVYHASIDDSWQFTSFGNSVIAVNGGDVPQIMTMGNLGFSPLVQAPFAKAVATVRDFLVLGNVVEQTDSTRYPQRLHWSAIGDATSFPTIGTNAAVQLQSDVQDLRSDLGEIRAIASNLQTSDMAVFMDNGVYVGYYVGSPAIFNFQIAQGAVGCRIPHSIITHEGFVYYLGNNGFYKFDGTSPRPIGAQKVDNFFFNDKNNRIDVAYIDRVQGAADPLNKLIYWLYHGPNSNGVANRLLIYSYILDRWGFAELSAQWLSKSISLGYSLDELDPFAPAGIDSLPYSLDSPAWKGGSPGLYAFDASSRLSQFSGPNLAARLETSEVQLTMGMRSRVTNARPLVEGFFPNFFPSKPAVALGSRVRLEDQVQYNDPVAMNVYGECNHRLDSRYFRAVITIPDGAMWDHVLGVEVNFAQSTRR